MRHWFCGFHSAMRIGSTKGKKMRTSVDRILTTHVISHCTPVVEHPELVAQRLLRFAEIVGRERVMAGTDCGLGIRTHPQVALAKLKSMADGAGIASKQLWGHA
jgi:5-methyltetrahydropteroyltriglutamate--homocysteine methyltransferase